MFPILEAPTFHCRACGKCCSNIQGFAGEAEKQFLLEYGYGKLPLVQLVPVEEMTFPLWEFEAKRFIDFSKELGIDAKIRPYRGVLDLQSNAFIVFNYQMNSKACPFLKQDGKCGIYGKERAFVCNLFPLNRSPFLNVGAPVDKSIFGTCGGLETIPEKLDYKNNEKLISQLYHSFGHTFLAAVQHDFVIEWANHLIVQLMKEKKIRPALNYPREFLAKRIGQARHVDLFEFLIEIEHFTSEEAESTIEKFRSYEHAKERVKQVIGPL
ncbi:MAG: YkgJ family cysteine cluster protein [Nanoarchaeota archaeon]|nr:YkgJ family cysteine cluster protein [Nanoarchaeota archaeon]